jgi:hypothetical protein
MHLKIAQPITGHHPKIVFLNYIPCIEEHLTPNVLSDTIKVMSSQPITVRHARKLVGVPYFIPFCLTHVLLFVTLVKVAVTMLLMTLLL